MHPVVAGAVAFALAAAAMRFLRRPLRAHRVVIGRVAAGAAGVAAAVAGAAPTGLVPLDVLLRAGLGVGVVLLAYEAAYGWVTAGAVVLAVGAVAATDPVAWPVAVAVGVAAVLPVVGAGSRALQAVAAAFAVTGLLHLGAGPRDSLLIGVPAMALLTVPALHRIGGQARRRILVGAAGVVVAAAAFAAIGVVALLGARRDIEAAADLSVQGLDVLGEDDSIAAAYLQGAAIRFDAAHDRLGAWWVQPARLVPVVAQHVRAASTLTDVGDRLAEVAQRALDDVDIDRLAIHQGVVDLDAVRAAQPAATAVTAALERSRRSLEDVASPWLTTTVGRAVDDVTDRVEAAAEAAETVTDVTDVLPSLLGGEGTRRYLLIAQNPNEAEGAGGFPGNFGEIVADGGTLDLVRTGRLDDLIEVRGAGQALDMTPEAEALFAGGDSRQLTWQNSTIDPDFTETAAVLRQLYAQSGGPVVDGVVSVDPIALDALLALTGPVYLPDADVRLEHGSAAQLFLHDQYVTFDRRDERGQRIDLLDEAIDRVWDAVTAGDLGTLRQLTDVLAASARGRHVQVASFDPSEQAALAGAGLTGELPTVVSDGIGAVVQQNSLNKMDWFVDRDSRYEATWDPRTGQTSGTYSFRLANRAPSSGLPDSVIGWGGRADAPGRTAPGEWSGYVFVYSALPPEAVRVDGAPVDLVVLRHQGWYVTFVELRVPSGGTGRVDVDVAGTVPVGSYQLATVQQASVNGDDFSVVIGAVGDTSRLRPDGDARRLDAQRFAGDATLDSSFRFGIFGAN